MTLESWGYTADRDAQVRGRAGVPGRVVLELYTAVEVQTAGGRVRAGYPKAWLGLERPAVGDWVVVHKGQVTQLLERHSVFVRQAAGDKAVPQVMAANLDVVFVLTSLSREFSRRRVERYLVAAMGGGAEAVLVLTKADEAQDRERIEAEARRSGPVEVLVTSARTREGIDALLDHLGPGRTGSLVGSSGVGKSTLLNALLGEEAQQTREVRDKDQKGRHTTTRRALFLLPGDRGMLVDSPGMREIQPWGRRGLALVFPEIEERAQACRWRDCRHQEDEGCAVQEAAAAGAIDPDRLAHWRSLGLELIEQERARAFVKGG